MKYIIWYIKRKIKNMFKKKYYEPKKYTANELWHSHTSPVGDE